MDLGPCVTTITCLAVYLTGYIHGTMQSKELGPCDSNITFYAVLRITNQCRKVLLKAINLKFKIFFKSVSDCFFVTSSFLPSRTFCQKLASSM